jgi:hypothetical protein
MPETYVHPSEVAVKEGAVQTFRELLPIVAPNICGYEMAALPALVKEGAERLRSNRDHYKRLYEQRGKDAADAEDRAGVLGASLETLQAEMVNFAYYSRSVAEEADGQRRLMWQERAEWADRLAEQARTALAFPRQRLSSEEDR